MAKTGVMVGSVVGGPVGATAGDTMGAAIIAAAEANPIDVLLQDEAIWYPAIPENRYQVIPTVGALSYEDVKQSPIEPVRETRKVRLFTATLLLRRGLDLP